MTSSAHYAQGAPLGSRSQGLELILTWTIAYFNNLWNGWNKTGIFELLRFGLDKRMYCVDKISIILISFILIIYQLVLSEFFVYLFIFYLEINFWLLNWKAAICIMQVWSYDLQNTIPSLFDVLIARIFLENDEKNKYDWDSGIVPPVLYREQFLLKI